MKVYVLFLLLSCMLMGTAAALEPQPSVSLPLFPTDVLGYKDLAYIPKGHVRQNLDLYIPKKSNGPLPLIVWIHGGGWKYGSKDPCPILGWSRKGYVVASINYRLGQDAKFPAQIKDCKAAICWLRSHAKEYKIDPDRVVAWGESAGGHLASLVGTAGDVPEWERGHVEGSSDVQAVIDWYGRTDLTPVSVDPAFAGSSCAFLLGGSGHQVDELARKASPILHVSKDDPPFLIMHGDMDEVVPLRHSQSFAKALSGLGVKVKLLVLKGVGHGGKKFLNPEYIKVIDTFLTEHLGRRKTARIH